MWLRWPTEIEIDLLDRGYDIAHWHQLTINPETGTPRLSSRRLLTLLEFGPEDGPFKTAAERGGRWSSWKQMLAEIANEGYRFRSSYHAVNSTPENDARFDPTKFEFLDPIDQEIRAKREAEEAAAADEFNAQIGYS